MEHYACLYPDNAICRRLSDKEAQTEDYAHRPAACRFQHAVIKTDADYH